MVVEDESGVNLVLEGQEDPRSASRNPVHKHRYDVDS